MAEANRDRRFLVIDNAMDSGFVDAMRTLVLDRRTEFAPAGIYHRERGAELAQDTRNCVRLGDLGALRTPFQTAVEQRTAEAAAWLGLNPRLTAGEFEICAYGDAGFFESHQDMVRAPGRVRTLTCVYYFAFPDAAFTGGELRIHAWPRPMPGSDLPSADIAPTTNRLIFLPSILPHEVRPVHVPTAEWRDYRFNLTCWFWQAM